MKDESKLTDAIIDLGVGMKEMRNGINELRDEMKGLRKDMNFRLEKLEVQQVKTNIQLAEHTRSILVLAEQQEETNVNLEALRSDVVGLRTDFNNYAIASDTKFNGHEKRIVHLENSISGDGDKGIFVAKEPLAGYKKKARSPARRKEKK